MQTDSQKSEKTSSTPLWGVCSIITAILIAGALAASLIHTAGMDSTDRARINVFYHLYTSSEPVHFLLLIVLTFLSFILVRFDCSQTGILFSWQGCNSSLFLIAVFGVFIVSLAGRYLVFHNFPLCMDEYLAVFQAEIFTRGQIHAVILEPWWEFAKALSPLFTRYDPDQHTWISAYLPVYSASLAGLSLLKLEGIANPLFGAMGALALAGVARNVWPASKTHQLISVLMLVTSSQFLLNSMTYYSLPAHLCLSLIWLWLYTREDRLGMLLTPWVGSLAIGLHQPIVHALFVLPFLVRLARTRRWPITLYFVMVYSLACLGWWYWMTFIRTGIDPERTQQLPLSSFFSLPGFLQGINQIMYVSMLVSWQSLAMTVLLLLAIKNWTSLTPLLKDLAISCALTFGFYIFFRLDQGHGWGYRYCYAVLGNLALLAAAGWRQLEISLSGSRAWNFMLFSSAVALCIQFPTRCLQVESFVRPFARSMSFLSSIEKPFVVLDDRDVWYSWDLVRNDPFLRSNPKIFFADRLTVDQSNRLARLGEIYRVRPEDLTRFGMHRTTHR
jgi:hypothetical protein